MARRVCTVITPPIRKCRSPQATCMPPARNFFYVTSPLHVISPRDPCTWPLCSSTQFVELSWLNTSPRFYQKCNFFGALKIRSVSTWRITWLLPFTLSIPLWSSSSFYLSTRLTVLQSRWLFFFTALQLL